MTSKYYIIYQGSGGLIHMLGGLAHSCNFVNSQRNSILVINVENHIAFQSKFSNFFYLNNVKYTEDYEEVLSKFKSFKRIPLKHILENNCDDNYNITYNNTKINIRAGLSKYIPKTNLLYLYAGFGCNNHLDILKYVKVNPDIMEKIKLFKLDYEYVGVHFRNTDIKQDYNKYVNKLKQYEQYTIYLATDDYNAYDYFCEKLPNHKIIRFTKAPKVDGNNIHFHCDDKPKQVLNLLIDMYVLYNSTIFIESHGSLVSRLVNTMRKENKSIFL